MTKDKILSFRVSEDIASYIDKACEKEGINRSSYLSDRIVRKETKKLLTLGSDVKVPKNVEKSGSMAGAALVAGVTYLAVYALLDQQTDFTKEKKDAISSFTALSAVAVFGNR